MVSGKKGHLLENLHCQVIERAQELLSSSREVILLGDGEFDGIELLQTLAQGGWEYVCRTPKNAYLFEEEVSFGYSDLLLQPGGYVEIENVSFTLARYGPLTIVGV